VTFENRQVILWAWQEVKREGMSINDAVYAGVIEIIIGPNGRRRWCKVDVVAMGWCCSAHTKNEVSSCAGGVAGRSCVYFGHEEAVWFEWDCL
jgi:hypothetical protein